MAPNPRSVAARLPPPAVQAVLYLGAYWGLNELSRVFSSPDILFLWYPPAALTLVLLWLHPRRGLPLAVVAGLLPVLGDLHLWSHPWKALPFAVGNAVAYAAGVEVLRRSGTDPALSTRRDAVQFFAVGGVATTLLSAVLGTLGFTVTGVMRWSHFWHGVGRYWMGDLAGVTTFAVPLLLIAAWAARPLADELRVRRWERLGMAVSLGATSYVSTALWSGQLTVDGLHDLQLLALPMAPLAWIAVREGLVGVALGTLVVNVTTMSVANDYADSVGRALTLQSTAATTALVGLVVGATSTRRRAADAQRTHDALHDQLTGLPNRTLFADRVSQALASAREDGATTAVLHIGLDRFARVNSSLGRPAGDRVLRTVAWRLATGVGPRDTVARLGGDEFAVLIVGAPGTQEVATTAEQILRGLDPQVSTGGHDLFLRASVGIATSPAGFQSTDVVLQDAESALRLAKRSGGGCSRWTDEETNALALSRLGMERDLRGALDGSARAPYELQVHFQALVRAGDESVQGAEALLRWTTPHLGPVEPPAVIALAEEIGLDRQLCSFVLGEACRQAASWSAAGHRPHVAVNISPRMLSHPFFVDDVMTAIADAGIEGRQLVLEVTESSIVDDNPLAVDHLSALRGLGVRTSIDDFGTGYSSLAYLTRLPVDELKIDQSFVRLLGVDPSARAIVEAAVTMAHGLGLVVVAEGVETRAQALLLQALGCETLQGHHYGAAMPAPHSVAELADPRVRQL